MSTRHDQVDMAAWAIEVVGQLGEAIPFAGSAFGVGRQHRRSGGVVLIIHRATPTSTFSCYARCRSS